jgi:hypothetical protein
MKLRSLILLSALIAGNAQAQLITGTNTGAIPDGAGTGPNNFGAPRDIRFLATSPGTVQDVKVVFQANHPFVGDLKVTLISPQGIEHLLFNRTGATTATAAGSAANLISTHAGYGFRDNSANNWWTLADIGNVDIPVSNARSVIAGPTTSPAAVTSINLPFLDKPVAQA